MYDENDLREKAEKCVRDIISPENAVLSLITKRIFKVLLRGLLNQPYQQKLGVFSLASPAQERNLSSTMELVKKVFNHSWLVHGNMYRAVLIALCDGIAGV